MATNGLVVMTPTSVDITGGGSETSTTNADGSVSFSACATLSLNGVFTSDYDNYMIAMGNLSSTDSGTQGFTTRLRASGTDNSTASSYVYQYLFANSTTITAARNTQTFWFAGAVASSTENKSGNTLYLFGPYLAQPTAFRVVNTTATSGASLFDYAGTHNQSTAYDGITFSLATNTFAGILTVFGFNQ